MSKPFEVFTAEDFYFGDGTWNPVPSPANIAARANALLNERGKRVYGFNDATGAYTFDRHIDEDDGDTHEALLLGEREIDE